MIKHPIFIHSLFRAGSTYLFNVFRRSQELYWCYQEPLHELAIAARDSPQLLLELAGVEQSSGYRHSILVKPYFQELYDVWPCWKDEISKSAIFDAYFAPEGMDIGISYWRALADAAKGRPVFQECRTASRIAAIKEKIGGFHIYLWRNPWDQWWSYKVTEYFDDANQLIINAPNAPAAVQALRSDLGFQSYSSSNIAEELAHFSTIPRSAEQSYLVFYMLWCLGLQEGAKHAHLMLNIDRLSDSLAYRDEIQAQLIDAGIDGVDFSDCHVPQGRYLDQDRAFFTTLEEKVHLWLKEGGWTQDGLNHIQGLRQQFEPTCWHDPIATLSPTDLAEQANRARILARRSDTKVAKISDERSAQVARAEAIAIKAEAGATEAEARATYANARVTDAEARATEANARATEAEARATGANARATDAEVRATDAETRATDAEARATDAEARATDAEARATDAEARATDAEARTQQEAVLVAQAEKRALLSESRLQQTTMELGARQAEAELRANQAISDLEATRKELHDVHQANHYHWVQLETIRKELYSVHQANHYHWELAEARGQHIQALQTSHSWKVTAPMRWIAASISGNRTGGVVPPEPTLLNGLIRLGMARPKLVSLVRGALSLTPALHKRLASRVEQAMGSQHTSHVLSPPTTFEEKPADESDSVELAPDARQIYIKLKAAIENRKREQT